MEYGVLTDDKFYDRIKPAILVKNIDGKYFTIDEYRDHIKSEQTDKDDKLVVLYASDADQQHQFISSAKARKYDVALFNSPLSSHFIQKLETSEENISFARVDADTLDKLIQKDINVESNLSEDQKNELKPVIEEVINKEKFNVQFESLNEKDLPFIITQSEFLRRMKEQSEVGGGGMPGMGALPENYNLVVNSNHPLTSKILVETDGEKKKSLVKQAADLAMLSQGMLKGEELSNFISRSLDLMD